MALRVEGRVGGELGRSAARLVGEAGGHEDRFLVEDAGSESGIVAPRSGPRPRLSDCRWGMDIDHPGITQNAEPSMIWSAFPV